jgi:hypothetical protein
VAGELHGNHPRGDAHKQRQLTGAAFAQLLHAHDDHGDAYGVQLGCSGFSSIRRAYGTRCACWQTYRVTGAFSTATIIVGLAVAAWAAVYLIMGRSVGRYLQGAELLLAAMFVVLAIGGIAQMLGTDREFARAEFVGYLLLSPLIPVGAWWWSKNDETRAGSAVVLVVGLVMPVLVVRIQQVWAGV